MIDVNFHKDSLGSRILQFLGNSMLIHGAGCVELQLMLNEHYSPREFYFSETVFHELERLRLQSFVIRVPEVLRQDGFWKITEEGREYLEALNVKASEPIQVTVCNAPEVPSVAVATLCVTEDELNDWWHEFDIDIKAEIFAMFVLGSSRSLSRTAMPVSKFPDAVSA
jgi:hypothetical protein